MTTNKACININNANDSEVSGREDILEGILFLSLCIKRILKKKEEKKYICVRVPMPEVVKKKRNIASIHYLTTPTNNNHDSVFFLFFQKQKKIKYIEEKSEL